MLVRSACDILPNNQRFFISVLGLVAGHATDRHILSSSSFVGHAMQGNIPRMLEFFYLTDPKTLHPAQLLPVALRTLLACNGSSKYAGFDKRTSIVGSNASISKENCYELLQQCHAAVCQVAREDCTEQDSGVADALDALMVSCGERDHETPLGSAVNVCDHHGCLDSRLESVNGPVGWVIQNKHVLPVLCRVSPLQAQSRIFWGMHGFLGA
jgi:hypothetical protein